MTQISRGKIRRDQNLETDDFRTLGLSALGGALEFFDFVIFVFLTKTLSHLFFPEGMSEWLAQVQVYGIFAAGYLARPLGGIVMAHFGDKGGRKKMFAFSVFLMALPTLMMGFLPVYSQVGAIAPILLLTLRIVQGLAIGGEVPAAWVFVAEHVPRSRIGIACASLTSGLTAGILMGSLLATALHTQLSTEELHAWGWRLPFWLGGAFGFLAVWLRKWLRKWLSETPVFEALRAEKSLHEGLPLGEVLRLHRGSVAISMLATWVLTAGILVMILMAPTLVQSGFGIPADQAFRANAWASLLLCFGCLAGGALVDVWGGPRALAAGSVALGLSAVALFLDLRSGGGAFLLLSAISGFFVGVAGIVPSILIAAFPARVRFSGVSFSYNLAYAIFGALTPPLISSAAAVIGPMSPAYYVLLTALVGVGLGLFLASPKGARFDRHQRWGADVTPR